MAGRGKLGLGPNPAKGELRWQGEGDGEWEGTETHPFEALIGLGEVGKVVADVEPKGGGGMALGAELRRGERRKGGVGISFKRAWGSYL
jgi:hypothetical protein